MIIAASERRSGDGIRPYHYVLRFRKDVLSPYVIHNLILFGDGTYGFSHGYYARTIHEAVKVFDERLDGQRPLGGQDLMKLLSDLQGMKEST